MVVDKSEIEKQAKEILDKFANALEKVEKEAKKENYVDRDEFEREEGINAFCDDGFKKNILENAPSHDENFILTQKGDWK